MYIKEVVCLMIKSPKFTHSKKDNNKAQGRSTHLTAIVVSLVLSIIMITISVFNVSAVVIDVSSHDGLIDWNRIEEHVEGVIIRIGYGNDIEGQDDKQAIRNMNECERLGIPYGVYIYSYALTSDEVTSEINHTLRMLQGRSPVRGVWFDMEDADGYKKKKGVLDKEHVLEFTKNFCSKVKAEGYYTGIYASTWWFDNWLNEELDDYDKWVAEWGANDGYYHSDTSNRGTIHQYTSIDTKTGTNIDKNAMYVDFDHYKVDKPSDKPNDDKPSDNPSDSNDNSKLNNTLKETNGLLKTIIEFIKKIFNLK